ncbi:hypothetical protein ACFLUA_04130 [Chloroflexota bacterium]
MFKNKKLVYRVLAAFWLVIGILSIAGGTYRLGLLTIIFAVVMFLLSKRTGNGSTSESSEEEQE